MKTQKRKQGIWYSAVVYTKALGFGKGYEVQESQPITVKPTESISESLSRHGYNPSISRAELIDI